FTLMFSFCSDILILITFPTRRSSDLHGEKTILEVKYWKNAFPVSLVDPSEQTGFDCIEYKPKSFTYFTGDAYIVVGRVENALQADRKSTRLNYSHVKISYADFCLKKK